MERMSSNVLFPVTTRHFENSYPSEIANASKDKYFIRAQNAGRDYARSKLNPIKSQQDAASLTPVTDISAEERFRILLIATAQHERQSICNKLSRHLDFVVTYLEADCGELALQMIGREVVDLVIFGNNIVDIGILEFIGRLNHKSGRSKVPVITILNSSAEITGINAMKMGAYAYLLNDAEEHHAKLLPILVSRLYAKQQEMRRTTVKQQTLIESIPAVFYKLSLQGGRHDVHISPQVTELGISADKWGSDAELHHRMCHEEDRPFVRKALEHSYQTGSDFQCDYRIKTFGDSVSWFHDKAKVVMDKNGHPLFLQGVMLLGMMTGTTYLKSLEAELAHFRSLFDKMVCERTERLDQRLAILEYCNASLSDNYQKMREMYLTLKCKYQALDAEMDTGGIT